MVLRCPELKSAHVLNSLFKTVKKKVLKAISDETRFL